MDTQLVRFDITGLYGVRDYSIKLTDNNVIIVGENGSGKTTVLKIMYYALSCNWDLLRTFKFEQVTLYFSNNSQASIRLELLKYIFETFEIERYSYRSARRIPLRRRQRDYDDVINLLIEIRKAKEKSDEDLYEQLFDVCPLSKRYIDGALQDPKVSELLDQTNIIENSFDATILYLPTYRRIEEQLDTLFPYMDSNAWDDARRVSINNRSIELVDFGMGDVEDSIRKYQEHLKDFSRDEQKKLTLGYLSEIIGKEYEQVDIEDIRSLNKQEINDILMRMESSILSDKPKEEITDTLVRIKDNPKAPDQERDKLICHYFLKLIKFNEEMENEEASLLKFLEICNKYLVCNQLVYDKQDFECRIINNAFERCGDLNKDTSNEIGFQALSSGEKQIVSLFSHLNLGESKKLFVLIDEPELSLSVYWQKMFLVDILDTKRCIGLVATTHSPFIFDNDLEKYVHGINEFCTKEHSNVHTKDHTKRP